MSSRPIFVDNRNGNTLALAIRDHLRRLRNSGTPPEELCIATAYFNPQGFNLVSEEIKQLDCVRLLLGAEPLPETYLSSRTPYDPHEPELTMQRVRTALVQLDSRLRKDRNLLPFDLASDRAIRNLIRYLESGRIEVRRYDQHFLHAKAFIFRGDDRGLVSGSSNLTRAGLESNLELNLGHYEDPLLEKVEDWFEELWAEASPYDLSEIYEELLAPHDPYLIYLKVLWHLYHDELSQEEEETGHIPVTTFQKHGVWRARRILERYGGVLIADGVGLGKTYTAGEIIRDYRDRRQRVLLVCPAALRDTAWKRFLNDFQLMVDMVSYEQLARDAQLGGDTHHLSSALEDYALVVVDEAHNYRNPDTPTRAAILRELLAGKRRDLLLLTATPVNNSLWDLYHVLRYFMKQDAALADKGVLSIRARFDEAMRTDPYSLSPDLLYPIIDATTVKRTRRFVKKHYQNDMIKGRDGVMVPIHFPKPIASSIHYDLDQVLPGFFDRLEETLMPEEGSPLLKMARYQPERYLLEASRNSGDSALVGLLRCGLLKRFESSAHAFGLTISRMIVQHEAFLAALELDRVASKDFFKELSAAGDEGDIEEILDASENTENSALYDKLGLRSDVQEDLTVLRQLAEETSHIAPAGDPKLSELVEELVSIVEGAAGIDEDDERQKRKVLVFSHYEDTVDWIAQFVEEIVAGDPRLACYRDRIATVSGQESRGGINREKAINGFAPISTGALPPHDVDQFDLLICTDVLAEGMNLQQCRNIINYDLPWNPMRLVQRHGRVDRIGSQHTEVYLRTFFPDRQLDRLLKLEERVRVKLAQAAASVGVENAPIEAGVSRSQTFSDTREEIEKLYAEDATIYEEGGSASAAQTGEEYRQELRTALSRYGDTIEDLPWRIGSGLVKGEQPGHFFCASIDDRLYLRFVSSTNEGEIIGELGTCLRMIECTEETEAVLSEAMADGVFAAWSRAREDIHAAWMLETDPANLQPTIRRLNREVAAFLRANPPGEIEHRLLDSILDSVESPWSRREENQIRQVWKNEFDTVKQKSQALVDEIARIGIEPFVPPDPLPIIERSEIHLICWMAIQSENPGAAT